MSRVRLTAFAVASALVLPAPATGQEGVFVDPDSPSGKEYQIPLESVRRQANPRTRAGSKVVPGERSSPLFGEGIESDAETGSSVSGSGGAGGGGGSGDSSSGAPGGDAERAAREVIRGATARPGAPASGASSTLVIVGGAALVLLAGGVGGYALRRGGRSAA